MVRKELRRDNMEGKYGPGPVLLSGSKFNLQMKKKNSVVHRKYSELSHSNFNPRD